MPMRRSSGRLPHTDGGDVKKEKAPPSYDFDGCRTMPQLDAIVDVVLAYRPKAKSKPAKRRKRRAAKLAKDGR